MMTGPVQHDRLSEAATRLHALAPSVLGSQTGHAVTAASSPPPPDLRGRTFQLALQLPQDLPVVLQLWLSDGLLAQLAAAWRHEVTPADIGCEMINIQAGQLLTGLAVSGADGHMGLPRDAGAALAPRAAAGWWRCSAHWLHMALLPGGES